MESDTMEDVRRPSGGRAITYGLIAALVVRLLLAVNNRYYPDLGGGIKTIGIPIAVGILIAVAASIQSV